MKRITILILFFANYSYAQNYMSVGTDIKKMWRKKSSCVNSEKEKVGFVGCFDVTQRDPRFHESQTSMVDDTSKPIYKPKYNLESCDSDSDCQTKQGAKVDCLSGDITGYEKNTLMPGYSLFCYGISGYEQMSQTILVENAALKASVQAADAQKASDASALQAIAKDAMFGNRMIAFVGARIRAKSLNLADTKTVLSTYSSVIDLLRAGSIPHAKSEITSMTPDGTLVSQSDKDALLAEIDAYLGL